MRLPQGGPPSSAHPARVLSIEAVMPLRLGAGLSLRLPALLLWALAWKAGDLLIVERETREGGDFPKLKLVAYERIIETALQGCLHPWRHVEPYLGLPMAQLGGDGGLNLSEPWAAELKPAPGAELILRAGVETWPRLSLERPRSRQEGERLSLTAWYTLPVEAGDLVRVPEEALWATSAAEPPLPAAISIPPWMQGVQQARLTVSLTEGDARYSLAPLGDL